MKYIDEVLQPGETVVFSCTLSWAASSLCAASTRRSLSATP